MLTQKISLSYVAFNEPKKKKKKKKIVMSFWLNGPYNKSEYKTWVAKIFFFLNDQLLCKPYRTQIYDNRNNSMKT
jgi:hypothetical protein